MSYISATVRITEDAVMRAPAVWSDESMKHYAGCQVASEDGEGSLTLWIDWEAIPRLCHLLTEVYSRRPQKQESKDEMVARALREDR